ncbi:MAG TPA: hypothetical protein DDZ88_31545 [Verrucomicrobiales bacterium]|nr:hypothetical protein [Verrucomicrobiales bacterium]
MKEDQPARVSALAADAEVIAIPAETVVVTDGEQPDVGVTPNCANSPQPLRLLHSAFILLQHVA